MAHHMTCAFGTFTISTFTIITICQHHHQRQCGGGVCECGGGVCLFPPVSACFCLNVPEWMASIGWPIYGCGFSRRRWQTRSSGYSMRVKTLLEKYFNVVSIMRTDGDTLLAMLLEAYSSRKKKFLKKTLLKHNKFLLKDIPFLEKYTAWLPGCSLVPWLSGSLVVGFPGSPVLWFPGYLVPWFPGSLVPWFPGSLVPWFPEKGERKAREKREERES